MTLSFCTTAMARPGTCHAVMVSRASLSMMASLSCADAAAASREMTTAMTKRRMRGILVGHAHRFRVPRVADALLRRPCRLRTAGARHALLRHAKTGRRRGDRRGMAAVPGQRDHVAFSIRPDDLGSVRPVARRAQRDRARADAHRADRPPRERRRGRPDRRDRRNVQEALRAGGGIPRAKRRLDAAIIRREAALGSHLRTVCHRWGHTFYLSTPTKV